MKISIVAALKVILISKQNICLLHYRTEIFIEIELQFCNLSVPHEYDCHLLFSYCTPLLVCISFHWAPAC